MSRKGFTLIELLIVVVIIGILASIAIPRFGETRQRAYVSAMQSDLNQLVTAQELHYHANGFEYWEGEFGAEGGGTPDDLAMVPSEGVTVAVTAVDSGWFAAASHAATARTCDTFVGLNEAPGGVEHATAAGAIACGES